MYKEEEQKDCETDYKDNKSLGSKSQVITAAVFVSHLLHFTNGSLNTKSKL